MFWDSSGLSIERSRNSLMFTPILWRTYSQKRLSVLSRASFAERQALIHFAVNHEKCLLDTVLKALIEEKKISTRYYLVNLLSCFSLSCNTSICVEVSHRTMVCSSQSGHCSRTAGIPPGSSAAQVPLKPYPSQGEEGSGKGSEKSGILTQ